MRNLVFFYFLLFINLSGGQLLGQASNIGITHFGIEDGISHSLVTDIQQDQYGYVWLGTPNGLNRFDGYEFLTFTSFREVPHKLSDNYIQSITPTSSGKLALRYDGNMNDIDLINPSNFEVTSITLTDKIEKGAHILSVFVEKQQSIYVLWELHGEFKISEILQDGTAISIHQFKNPDIQIDREIGFIKKKNGDFLIYNGQISITKINDKGLSEVGIDFINFTEGKSRKIAFLKEDSQQRVWLSLEGYTGVYRLDEKEDVFKPFEIPYGTFNFVRLWEDKIGNLLFGQSDKIKYSPIGAIYLMDVEGNWEDFSSFNQIGKYMVELESENFYGTTLGATDIGLKIIKNNATTIKTLLTESSENSSRNRVMRGFAANTDNTVFFAQEDGPWFTLDLTNDDLQAHDLIDKNTGKKLYINCSTQLYFDVKTKYLYGVSCDPIHKEGVFLKVNPTTWEAETFRFPKKIRSFTRTDDGLFWLVCANELTDGQIFSFDAFSKTKTAYLDKEGNNPIANTYPNFIQKGLNGKLWIGTMKGIFEVDPKKNTSDMYDSEDGLNSNNVEALIQITDSVLIIGTSRGVDIFNKVSGTNKKLFQEDGLSNNHIYSLQKGEEEGTYWMGTIYGLTYYDSKHNIFKKFFKRDGLSHNEFNRFSHFMDKNGRFYFGGVNGLNIFKSKDLLAIEPAPKVILIKMQHFDNQSNTTIAKQTDLSEIKEITLKPNDKYLELFFCLPEYSDPRNNQFHIKLEGLDKEWTLINKTNRMLYNYIPPGSYDLLVKGAGSKGNWSKDPLQVKINVEQVYYKTWKFWLICALLFGLFIQLINQYLFKQKLKVEKIRTKLSSDLHDEVSGLLSGIAMQSELLEMVTTDHVNKGKLSKITEISRSAMSRMSDVIWSIDSRRDTVEDLIARMSEHAMDILEPLDVAWNMEVTNINREKKMPVLLRENLYFIFKEAINNIGKHAQTRQVTIRLTNQKDQFILSIENDHDSHQPLNKSHKTGQGTANMYMRAEKIDATLEIMVKEFFTVILKRKKFA